MLVFWFCFIRIFGICWKTCQDCYKICSLFSLLKLHIQLLMTMKITLQTIYEMGDTKVVLFSSICKWYFKSRRDHSNFLNWLVRSCFFFFLIHRDRILIYVSMTIIISNNTEQETVITLIWNYSDHNFIYHICLASIFIDSVVLSPCQPQKFSIIQYLSHL